MRPLFSNKRALIFILVSLTIIVLIFLALIVFVIFSPNSIAVSLNKKTQTSEMNEAVAALVTAILESTANPPPESAAESIGTEHPGVDQGSGLEDNPEIDKSLAETLTPTASQPVELSHTPQVTRTPNPEVESILENMNLSQKIGQMILTGIGGTTLTGETCQFIQRLSPGGVIYLGSNITSPYPGQLASLSNGLQNCIANAGGTPLFIAIDHEGAYVNRFPGDSPMTTFPPAMAFSAAGNPDLAYQAAVAAGQELRTNGINMVLGPVADVLTNYDNTVISQRSFGGDPILVGNLVAESVQGYLTSGVLPVLKHYPGHGDVSGDSHATLPVDRSDLTRLLATHLVPFRMGIESGAPAVMVGHISFPAVDPQGLPASLSAPLYGILTEELDFSGFSMSDSMGMGAITHTGLGVEAASVKAINAGLDMLMLVSPDLAESVFNQVLWAVQNGEISSSRIDQAVSRILEVKLSHGVSNLAANPAPELNWGENQDLAFEVGYQAVSLYRDHSDLIPLPSDIKSILIVGPEDGWGFYPLLRSALNRRGLDYNFITYSGYWYGPIPETNYLQIVPSRAQQYDLVLFFTWDSHPNRFLYGDNFQGQLVDILSDSGMRLIVIALKSPTDILDFPSVPTYLASMGTTRGQLQGIIDLLMGETEPVGEIPLPNLP